MTTEQKPRKSFRRGRISAEEWIDELKLHNKGTGQFGKEYYIDKYGARTTVRKFCCLGVAAQYFGVPDNCEWEGGQLRFGLSGYESFSDKYEKPEFLDMLGWNDVKVERRTLGTVDESGEPRKYWGESDPLALLVHVNDDDRFNLPDHEPDWFPVIQTIRYIDMVATGKLSFVSFTNVPFRVFREENRRSTTVHRLSIDA